LILVLLTALLAGDKQRSEFERRVEASCRGGVHEYLVVARRLQPQFHASNWELHELLAVSGLDLCSLLGRIGWTSSTATDGPVPDARADYDAVLKSVGYVLQPQMNDSYLIEH